MMTIDAYLVDNVERWIVQRGIICVGTEGARCGKNTAKRQPIDPSTDYVSVPFSNSQPFLVRCRRNNLLTCAHQKTSE